MVALYRKINSVVEWSENVEFNVFAMKSAIKECHHFQIPPPNLIQLEYTNGHDQNATGYLGHKLS